MNITTGYKVTGAMKQSAELSKSSLKSMLEPSNTKDLRGYVISVSSW